MSPQIFQQARHLLYFKPGVDLFASAQHKQLPRYYSEKYDPQAAGTDAFKADWLLEVNPYVNPPWYLIPKCLDKIIKDQAKVLMVVPKWEWAYWWPRFNAICVRLLDFEEAIYLKPDGTLWEKPRWDTRIGVLKGRRLSHSWTVMLLL